ncbi:MAG: type II toxin-antitoxin system death-on-curing family toxin [Candidatus Kerfeldbacteria bacterium]|nr:type II toxin-antitoxin system death-on-curing family toxin [Candidatus Kerfeldbacteria bacterium]
MTIVHLLKMHSFVIDETGGLHGIRDRGRLSSAVERPQQTAFGRELYPTILEKAAVYIHSIIGDHPFVDGNKRTAMAAAFVFLQTNHFTSTAVRGEIEQFALRVARMKLNVPVIASWLRKHTRKARTL